MHYRLELIMPNVENVEGFIKTLLEPFYEEYNDEDGNVTHYGFYYHYQIGGIWSGRKIIDQLDEKKMQEFQQWLMDNKITVSSVVLGKETLAPESQKEKVDKMWLEKFPESGFNECPLFSNAGNNLQGDILEYDKVKDFKCCRIIYAYMDEGKPKITFMLQDEFYNGKNWQESIWDGSFKHAQILFKENLAGHREEYINKITPKENWIVVTIDYYS